MKAKLKKFTVTFARDIVQYAELTVKARDEAHAEELVDERLAADESQTPLGGLKWYNEDNPPYDTRVCHAEEEE